MINKITITKRILIGIPTGFVNKSGFISGTRKETISYTLNPSPRIIPIIFPLAIQKAQVMCIKCPNRVYNRNTGPNHHPSPLKINSIVNSLIVPWRKYSNENPIVAKLCHKIPNQNKMEEDNFRLVIFFNRN